MLKVNCDLGERGVAHKVDDELIKYIDMANIACGGHAGDEESVDYYVNLCRSNNVKITAHLSYPDRENFGRKVISIELEALLESFDKQFALFNGEVKVIKPHGALYNELNVNEELAEGFVKWCVNNTIKELVLSPVGVVSKLARQQGIVVIAESFAERGYMLDKNNNPMLIPRGQPNAEIHEVEKAVMQYQELKNGFIEINNYGIGFRTQTICIHSDSKIALELAKAISNKG